VLGVGAHPLRVDGDDDHAPHPSVDGERRAGRRPEAVAAQLLPHRTADPRHVVDPRRAAAAQHLRADGARGDLEAPPGGNLGLEHAAPGDDGQPVAPVVTDDPRIGRARQAAHLLDDQAEDLLGGGALSDAGGDPAQRGLLVGQPADLGLRAGARQRDRQHLRERAGRRLDVGREPALRAEQRDHAPDVALDDDRDGDRGLRAQVVQQPGAGGGVDLVAVEPHRLQRPRHAVQRVAGRHGAAVGRVGEVAGGGPFGEPHAPVRGLVADDRGAVRIELHADLGGERVEQLLGGDALGQERHDPRRPGAVVCDRPRHEAIMAAPSGPGGMENPTSRARLAPLSDPARHAIASRQRWQRGRAAARIATGDLAPLSGAGSPLALDGSAVARDREPEGGAPPARPRPVPPPSSPR